LRLPLANPALYPPAALALSPFNQHFREIRRAFAIAWRSVASRLLYILAARSAHPWRTHENTVQVLADNPLKERTMKFSRILTAAVVSMMALPGYAMSVTEIGDAGELMDTAQSFADTEPNALDSISGKLVRPNARRGIAADYADMFKIWITGKTGFSASTVNANTGFDTQLFLFDSLGRGVVANDDDPARSGTRSFISGSFAAGYYYLAVSGYNNDPVSGASLMFPNSPFTTMFAATNPNLSITGWSTPTNPGVGSYQINLTGVATMAPVLAPVPLPPAAWMFGSAITAFAAVRRRSKKTT
jgi:hypothetical protein